MITLYHVCNRMLTATPVLSQFTMNYMNMGHFAMLGRRGAASTGGRAGGAGNVPQVPPVFQCGRHKSG